ncbi:MAG: A/G-specific adenine glycosylase [bacterium]
MNSTQAELADFKALIWAFYREHPRTFPWRETHDPYRIMLSELMLQQTQTARVVDKYNAWLEELPTVESLAAAPVSQVLTLWQGLGYNRRALNLQKAAKVIVDNFGGVVPQNPADMVSLPGIGPYTAGAISAFAFNRPVTFIETNIRRVYLHFFFPDAEAVSDKELMPLIEATVDPENPREWYYALMDYGAQLPKRVANPNRRSKHYSVQSKFEGSGRQARGRILAYLVDNGKATLVTLQAVLGLDPAKIEKGLSQLEDEGFLSRDDDTYQLSH